VKLSITPVIIATKKYLKKLLLLMKNLENETRKLLMRIQLDNVVKLLNAQLYEQDVLDTNGIPKKRIVITYEEKD
jgi:hypothetical protein